jgi:hypothetical protein
MVGCKSCSDRQPESGNARMRMKPAIAIGIALTFIATTGLARRSAVSEHTVPIQYVTAGARSFGEFFGCKGRSAAVTGAPAVTRLRLEIVPNLEAMWTPSTEVQQRALTPMDSVCTDFASTDVTPITPTGLGAKRAFDGNDAASREIARRRDEGMWIVANTGAEAAPHGIGVFLRK